MFAKFLRIGTRDYDISGFILGSCYFGKLPNVISPITCIGVYSGTHWILTGDPEFRIWGLGLWVLSVLLLKTTTGHFIFKYSPIMQTQMEEDNQKCTLGTCRDI